MNYFWLLFNLIFLNLAENATTLRDTDFWPGGGGRPKPAGRPPPYEGSHGGGQIDYEVPSYEIDSPFGFRNYFRYTGSERHETSPGTESPVRASVTPSPHEFGRGWYNVHHQRKPPGPPPPVPEDYDVGMRHKPVDHRIDELEHPYRPRPRELWVNILYSFHFLRKPPGPPLPFPEDHVFFRSRTTSGSH